MLRITLEAMKYTVIEAEDGKSALAAIQLKPDLILQDLILPDISGIDLVKKIREQQHCKDIPIIALSGFVSKMEENTTSELFTDSLIKPIEPEYLVKVIKSYLPDLLTTSKQIVEKKHIIIVDDNPAQLKLLSLQLQNCGYIVTPANSGNEALELMHAEPFDAIITDVLMPGIDGFELCLQIRLDPKLTKIPVILLSAHYLEDADIALANKVGANSYLTRQTEPLNILNKLAESIKETAPLLTSTSINLVKEEHTDRMIKQLEKQISGHIALEKRCALQSSQISLLNGIASALSTHSSATNSIKNILAICLDAAGISKGILYYYDFYKTLSLNIYIGFKDSEKEALEKFFGHQILLSESMANRKIIYLPSDQPDQDVAKDILLQSQCSSAILIPLTFANECYGVLFIGSKIGNINDSESMQFLTALGNQIGQSLALVTTFERLGSSEDRYKNIMDNASCAIFISTPEGKIQETNKQGEILYGCPKSEIIGKDYRSFIMPEDLPTTKAILPNLKESGQIRAAEIRIRRVSGEMRTVEFSATLFAVGKEHLVNIIVDDITERVKIRTQAALNEKMATVGMLAAVVAHEINNPTSYILTNLHFLKDKCAIMQKNIKALQSVAMEQQDSDHPLVQKIYELVNYDPFNSIPDVILESIDGAEKIRNIVKSLKGFSRLDEKDMSLVDVHEILDAALLMASSELKHHCAIKKEYATGLPKITYNPSKLHQVFLNIIINAAQAFTDNNIEHNQIKVATLLDNENVIVSISDTGKGIDSSILAKIFDPFFTTKPIGTGTGLGLFICHDIIAKLGGSITVESVVNQGTTFHITLPLHTNNNITK